MKIPESNISEQSRIKSRRAFIQRLAGFSIGASITPGTVAAAFITEPDNEKALRKDRRQGEKIAQNQDRVKQNPVPKEGLFQEIRDGFRNNPVTATGLTAASTGLTATSGLITGDLLSIKSIREQSEKERELTYKQLKTAALEDFVEMPDGNRVSFMELFKETHGQEPELKPVRGYLYRDYKDQKELKALMQILALRGKADVLREFCEQVKPNHPAGIGRLSASLDERKNYPHQIFNDYEQALNQAHLSRSIIDISNDSKDPLADLSTSYLETKFPKISRLVTEIRILENSDSQLNFSFKESSDLASHSPSSLGLEPGTIIRVDKNNLGKTEALLEKLSEDFAKTYKIKDETSVR
jgi:hypothetical protein